MTTTASAPPAPPDAAGPVPLISVRALSKSFGGQGGRPVPVLEDITLDVREGEFVALLGRSGSGKSTLLRCIAGLMAPTEGQVLFRGKPLTGTNRETSMVFQTFALMPWLTVQQNVELGLEARGIDPAARTERALRAIDIVGLDGYESAFPKELSGGMRQRVGFARALVVEPAALLMDEPFSALDVLTSENLRGELLELWEGHRFPTKTIVMVTHNIEEAVLLADRILVLGTNPGRIRSDMQNPLPRPRRRRTPDFDELVDEIYRMMTQRDAAVSARPPVAGTVDTGTVSDTPLPPATVDGLSGLAEIMIGMHGGAADLADLAESLGLEVDDLLPLVDSLVLLGFAELRDDRLELTASGQVFAGASIQDSKEIFARASLDRAPLVRTIYRALRASQDGNLPGALFTDILRSRYGEDDSARQLDTAINWGRYAELYDYDAARSQIIREDQGIGATIADAAPPPARGSLTTYLGAAPGAGKTYTMLREGRARRDKGEDVVIGFADPRDRPHTREAIGGLEVVPPRAADRGDGGRSASTVNAGPDGDGAGGDGADGDGADEAGAGMDVAAVLARRPGVVLVDDLGSHANAVDALRAAGIDVISTADVGDVRAVADQVAAVTGQPAPATISDEVLESIDALQFVDSSPEALRKRLGHGNIYPADRVAEALQTEFQPARLAALREIGLSLVATSVPAPGALRQRSAQDVLVVILGRSDAESLVLRGIRLARRRGVRCYVLALSQPGQPPLVLPDEAADVAAAAGATLLARDSRDFVGAIVSAVQETSARHVVLPVPPAALLERWRGSLLERLAGQLPAVHLHVLASGPGLQPLAHGEPGKTDTGGEHRRGAIRVYLGYAPGCGTTSAMLEEGLRRKARGTDVVVGAVAPHEREHVLAALEGLELIGDGSVLDTDAVLARRPEVVCVDDLTAGTTTAERRFAAARRLASAGITVVGTVQLGLVGGGATAVGADRQSADARQEAASGSAGFRDGAAFLDERALLALADELELVDVPPTILIDRVRRGEIVPVDQVAQALATIYQPQALQAERERAFRLVARHGEQQLAAYDTAGQPRGDERLPSVLACVAPWPGMEPLLRRSAAFAAQVRGRFLAASVLSGQAASNEEKACLAAYSAIAAQLGGELAVLTAHSAALALGDYAREHGVTEMVLARPDSSAAGRYRILRELAKVASDVEIHLLPAEPAD
jgi:NitT/TauT family transport system ATP-binding protein